jgi:hypothetical protein
MIAWQEHQLPVVGTFWEGAERNGRVLYRIIPAGAPTGMFLLRTCDDPPIELGASFDRAVLMTFAELR